MTGLICMLVLGAPITVWWISVGSPVAYLTHDLPPGQSLYIFSKLAGLIAFCLFWLQCLFALAHRAPVLNGFPLTGAATHRLLGLTTFGFALLHFGLFFAAASLRAGAPAWDLFVPKFTHGYYSLHVSLGLIGLWILVVGIYAGWRTSRGRTAWRKIHMVWPAVFILVFWHAFAIGSESRYGAMRYVWLFIATSLVAATLSRLHAVWRDRKSSSAAALESRG